MCCAAAANPPVVLAGSHCAGSVIALATLVPDLRNIRHTRACPECSAVTRAQAHQLQSSSSPRSTCHSRGRSPRAPCRSPAGARPARSAWSPGAGSTKRRTCEHTARVCRSVGCTCLRCSHLICTSRAGVTWQACSALTANSTHEPRLLQVAHLKGRSTSITSPPWGLCGSSTCILSARRLPA